MKAFLAALTLLLAAGAAQADTEQLTRNVAQQRLALALALAEAFDGGAVCDADAYPNDIVREVAAAKDHVTEAELNKFLAGLSESSKLRANLAFREALGQVNLYRRELTEAELTRALTGTVYFHFGQGAYGSGYNVTLEEGGRAHERTLELLDDEPWTRWLESDTTWSLVRNEQSSYTPWNLKVGAQEFRLERQEGTLWWVPVETKEGEMDVNRTLSASDSFCEA